MKQPWNSASLKQIVSVIFRDDCGKVLERINLKAKQCQSVNQETFLDSIETIFTDKICQISGLSVLVYYNSLCDLRLASNPRGMSKVGHFYSMVQNSQWSTRFKSEHPALMQHVRLILENIADNICRVLDRLTLDRDDLDRHFEFNLGSLERITGNLSDPHKWQQVVFVLHFVNYQLIYKPRSLGVDILFQELLSDVANMDASFTYKRVKCFDRNEYGWMEYVSYDPPRSLSQLKDYYCNLGFYLALFTLLRSADHHFENMIVAGVNPVFIDLECTFAPNMTFDRHRVFSPGCVGILPRHIINGSCMTDIGAISSKAYETSPELIWKNQFSDFLQISNRKRTLDDSKSYPHHPLSLLGPQHFSGALLKGYRRLFYLAQKNQSNFLLSSSPLRQLAECQMRVVVRNTGFYHDVLNASYDPQLMKDRGSRREFITQHVYSNRIVCRRLHEYEVESLVRGEIPLLQHFPTGTTMFGDKKELKGLIEQSGYDAVNDTLRSSRRMAYLAGKSSDIEKRLKLLALPRTIRSNLS